MQSRFYMSLTAIHILFSHNCHIKKLIPLICNFGSKSIYLKPFFDSIKVIFF